MPTHFQSVTSIIMLPELSMKVLHTHLKTNTPSTRHMYIVAILSFIKHHITHISQCITTDIATSLREQWNAIHTHNEAPIIQLRLENKPTVLQQAKGGSQLSFQQIMEIREQLPIGSIERLLLSIYTLIPPVRADYFALHVIHDDEEPLEPNYLRIRGGEIETVLRDFKTSKTYHEIRNTLPQPLAQEIHASLQESPRKYLFVNSHGRPHTRNSFTLWTRRILTRILQTDFTLVFFRHAFATHYVSHHNPTDLDISEVSKKMGHSSEMFRAYRWVTGDHADSDSDDS